MTCVCGGRKPIRIFKDDGIETQPWVAEVFHDGWDEVGWFDTWAQAFEWAWWRIA